MKRALSRKNLWEGLPPTAKSVVGSLLSIFPLKYLLGRQFSRHLRFLEEAQCWPPERFRSYQIGELRRICTLAYERTPYYRRSFKEVGFDPRDLKGIEDLQGVPMINRTIVRENLKEMVTVSVKSPMVDYVVTNGTSGEPLGFYIGSNRHQIEYAYTILGWQRSGFRLGMKTAVFKGRIVSQDHSGLWHEYDPILRQHFYSSFHMTQEDMQRYVEHLQNIGPCFLHVNPSAVAILARFIQRSGIEPPANVRGIIAESEIVYPEQRQMVEETFRCKYFSCYGHTEKLVAASECEKSTNYHVWPTYGFFELLDEKGRWVTTPGQRGEIVGTGFINTVVPFIRYRTGDCATYVGDHCQECGRAHPIIADIRGHRLQEFLVASDSSLVTFSFLVSHNEALENVLRFQFYQDTPGRALLRIIPMDVFSKDDELRILRSLNRVINERLKFTIDIVESIPLIGSAKAKYVDQHISGIESLREGTF